MHGLSIHQIMAVAPVIPVLTVTRLEHAVPLARALAGGGLRVLEVTLRTPAGLAAIEAMRRDVPEAIVGVGTLTDPDEFTAAARAGAQFGITRQTASDYLAQPNVLCVGGSWVAPADRVDAGDWAAIEALARDAAALPRLRA